MNHLFDAFTALVARLAGTSYTFLVAFLLIILWACTGPFFKFSETWQLVINTGTTIITFLMTFLIQSSQNRDTGAIQIKLDEIIKSIDKADNRLIDAENKEQKEIDALKEQYKNT